MTPEEELAALQEEEAILSEENSLMQEQQAITARYDATRDSFAPEAKTSEVPFEQAGVTSDDIDQLKDINQRELAQLQNEPYQMPSPKDGFVNQAMAASNAIGQFTSMSMNPVREFFGFEKRQPGTYISPVDSWQAGETERKISLSKRGIGSGEVDLKSRFVEGLAMDDKNRVKAVQKNLNKQFGTTVKVGVDKETGEPVYLNPNDDRMYTVNPLGFDSGDIAGYVGDAIVLGFETAGTLAGAALAGKKKVKKGLTDTQYSRSRRNKEVSLGAVGAGVGEAFRIALGRSFDINDEVTYGEIATEAAKEVALSAGFGVGFEALKAGLKKVRSIRGEAVVPGHILDKFKDKTDAIDEKNLGTEIGNNQFIDAMNDTLREVQSDQAIRPNVGQLLNDTDTLDIVESLKKTGTEERKPILSREESNLAAQKEYFTIIGEQVTDSPALGVTKLGENIQSVTNRSLDQAVGQAEIKTLASVDKSRELTQGLQKTTPYKAGEAIREAIFEEEAIFKGVANRDYRSLEMQALDLNLIPETFDMKLKLSLIDSGETGVKKERVTDLFEEGDFDLGNEWSLTKINNSIKDLRAKLKSYGSNKSDVQKGSMLKAIDILKETKRQALKSNPELLLKMDALDKVYSEGMEIFNDGISKAIIDDKAPIATSEIFNSVLKNSSTAKNVGTAIMDRPTAVLQMQKGINDLYKSKAVKNGIVILEDHKKFIRDYVDTKIITPFYSKQQLRGIKRAGAIGRIYDIEKKRSDKLIEKLNKTFKSDISVLDGRTLFNKVWGKDKERNIVQLREALSDHPKLWGSVQAEMLSDIKKTVISNESFSVRSFETLLNNKSYTIKEGLGEGYLKNLTMLKESLDVTGRKGKAYDVSEKSMIAHIVTVALGQLNPTTRKVNAADKVRSTYARKLIAEMVLEPEKLRKMSAIRRTRWGGDTSQLILTRMGFGLLTDGNDDDFRITLNKVGTTSGLLYKRQQQDNIKREKEQIVKKEKDKKERIQFLQSRQKTLSQY